MKSGEGQIAIGTRVFGDKFTPDLYTPALAPFIASANQFGEAVIVFQKVYPFKTHLEQFVTDQKGFGHDVSVVYSETEGNKSPADMCNQIVEYAQDKQFNLFAILSSDLAKFIPSAIPQMLATIASDTNLATVGIAIQGVHNFTLLNEVQKTGLSAVQRDNYATVFHNNAFSVHRTVFDNELPRDKRRFPRITDNGTLGKTNIDGDSVDIGGNEEIALMLQLLSEGYPLRVNLLAGDRSIIRDPSKELTLVDKKVQRRIPVARAYQEHFEVSNEALANYLHNGAYRISFL